MAEPIPFDLGLYDRFDAFAAATMYEAIGKRGDLAPGIRPVGAARRLCGPAFPVRAHVGDSRAIIEALYAAPPGAVLVVAAGGTDGTTVWGGTSTHLALRRGLRGLVTDGAVRDIADIRAQAFPVFAAAISVRGTLKNHPGVLGEPVAIGGAVVALGDLVVADEDGVVVVPHAELDGLLAIARAQKTKEDALDRAIGEGFDLRTLYAAG